jgi:DNA-binding CsgD family transcriptional regulator
MRIMIIDSCVFTLLGACCFFEKYPSVTTEHATALEQGLPLVTDFRPDIVLVNLTHYCRRGGEFPQLVDFFNACGDAQVYIYVDAPYPTAGEPITLTGRVSLMNKQCLLPLLHQIGETCRPPALLKRTGKGFLYSRQELAVIALWMAQQTNHDIARQLGICGRTVYVHKRQAIRKLTVRNRLEFCFLYHVLKYVIYPPFFFPEHNAAPAGLQHAL